MSVYERMLKDSLIYYVEIHTNDVQFKLGNGDLHILKEEWEKEDHGAFKNTGYVEVNMNNPFIKAITKNEIESIIDAVIKTKF